MPNPPQFSFELGTSPSSQRRSEQEPLRILLMTDLGETCQSRSGSGYASRPFRQMDVDIFEDYLETECPTVQIDGAHIQMSEMDHFHPDHVVKTLHALQELLDLRQQLRTPATLDTAARRVRALLTPATDAGADSTASDESDADTMSRLFGTAPNAAPTQPAQPTGSVLDRMIQQAVADHIVPDADPKAEPYIAAVEAAAAAHLRSVLHDPAFQSVEAAWRGLEMLVSRIETDETLSIHVWNVSKSELLDGMGPVDAPPDASVLHKRLVADRANAPFSLIATDAAIGDSADDLRLLATLGAIAGRTGAVALVPLTPPAFGAPSWSAMLDTPAAPETGIAVLGETGMAEHIVGLGPRFLMRQPYGKRSDPIDSFAFEEIGPGPLSTDDLLWGAPSLVATVLIANAFSEDGWSAHINQTLEYDDLPLVYYDDAGEQAMLPCAELLLSDANTEKLLSTGLTPLVAVKNHNAVRLPYFRTLARSGNTDRIGPFTT